MREFIAKIVIDEENHVADIDKAGGVGDYLESEMGWVSDSGIFVDQWFINDDDEDDLKYRYRNYVANWCLDTYFDDESEGCTSPMSFEAWKYFEENSL